MQEESLKEKIIDLDGRIADVDGVQEEDPFAAQINELQGTGIPDLRSALTRAERAVKDPLSVFGSEMRRFVNEIDRFVHFFGSPLAALTTSIGSTGRRSGTLNLMVRLVHSLPSG